MYAVCMIVEVIKNGETFEKLENCIAVTYTYTKAERLALNCSENQMQDALVFGWDGEWMKLLSVAYNEGKPLIFLDRDVSTWIKKESETYPSERFYLVTRFNKTYNTHSLYQITENLKDVSDLLKQNRPWTHTRYRAFVIDKDTRFSCESLSSNSAIIKELKLRK